jgi:hypothetical protein
MYDYVIVGGGISGLYMYMNLLQKTSNICLLEKNDYFGGRIKQYNEKILGKNISFPEGAARFNNNHKKVIKLLKKFDLFDSQTSKVSSDIEFIDTENEFSNKFNGENGFKYINSVLEKSNNYDKHELQNMTFQELAQKILKKTELEFMLKSSGYTGQLKNMNSYDAIHLFDKGIRIDMKYYVGVFQRLIDSLLLYLHKHNATLKLKVNVLDIVNNNETYDIYIKNKIIHCRNIICCVPKFSLLNFTCISPIKELLEKSVTCKPLCRVYAIFDENDIWFENLKKKVVVNNQLRYIIPIDIKKGLIMISYTDDVYTKYWNKIKNNQAKLKNSIVKLVNKTFDIQINEPRKVYVCYWDCGVAFWNKNMDSISISKKITNPIDNMFICGENYSRNQSWVEGALESCDRCLKLCT